MKIQNIDYLHDAEEMKNCLEALQHSLGETKPCPMAETISELIIFPLESYIEKEHKRAGGHRTGTNAAMSFLIVAEDVKYQLETPGEALYSEHVKTLERAWRAWLVAEGWSAHFKITKQLHSSKNKKNPEILEACKRLALGKRNNSAGDMFIRFPLRPKALTIDGVKIFREDTGEGEEKIYAEYPNGKAHEIGKRAFADYYKEVKKYER